MNGTATQPSAKKYRFAGLRLSYPNPAKRCFIASALTTPIKPSRAFQRMVSNGMVLCLSDFHVSGAYCLSITPAFNNACFGEFSMPLTGSIISLAALASAGLLGAAALSSRADITLTAQLLSGTGRTPPVPQAVTLRYQGANARLEVSGEPTIIQDGKANILYGLDTARKTYYVTVPTEIEPGTGSPDKDDVKLDLKETDKTMTFAGTIARRYLVTGSVARPRSQGFRQGGDRDGNEEGPEGHRRSIPLTPAQWSLTGEIWLSEAYKFPSKENTLFAAQLAAASSGPFQEPLADALDKHKGLPLLARMTVDYIPASSAGRPINQYGGVVEGAKASTVAVTTVTTFTVRSVTDAPLSDTLFQAPLNYMLVAAPSNPYVPGTPVSGSP